MVERNIETPTNRQRRVSSHVDPLSTVRQLSSPSLPDRHGPGIAPEFRTDSQAIWGDISTEGIIYFDRVVDDLRENIRSPTRSISSARTTIPHRSMLSQRYFSTDWSGGYPSTSSGSTSTRQGAIQHGGTSRSRFIPHRRSSSVPVHQGQRVDGAGRICRPRRTVPRSPNPSRMRRGNDRASGVNRLQRAPVDNDRSPRTRTEHARMAESHRVRELLKEIEVGRIEIRELRESLLQHQEDLLSAHVKINMLNGTIHRDREMLANARARIWLLEYGSGSSDGEFYLNRAD